MNRNLPESPALLLIDIQKGFDHLDAFGGERNNPDAEKQAGILLAHWRKQGWPLFHIRHDSIMPGSPLAAGHPGNEHKDEVKPMPGEPLVTKHVNSAFIGTDLKDQLDRSGARTVVIVGLITQHCVSTTARMAANYGYNTIVISDATAAFRTVGPGGKVYAPQTVHELSLATLHDEFATILSTHELLEILQAASL